MSEDEVVEMAKKLRGQSKVAQRFLDERDKVTKLTQRFLVLRDTLNQAKERTLSLTEALAEAEPLFEELEKLTDDKSVE